MTERLQTIPAAGGDHGGNIEAARRVHRRRSFLDLSINVNPWGPPPAGWLRLLASLPAVRRYPQPYSRDGRAALAAFFRVSADRLALGNGAAELIHSLPEILPARRAVVFEPTFSEYARAFEQRGKPVARLPLTAAFGIDPVPARQILAPGDILFICQPNNPTGRRFPEAALLDLIRLAEARQAWTLVDESFLWFCGALPESSVVRYLDEFPRLLVLNSLTKIGAIPGLRLGLLLAGADIVRSLEAALDPWNVNRLAQALIPAIIEPKFLARTRERLARENRWLAQRLAGVNGLTVYPWEVNYFLAKVGHPDLNGTEFIRRLGERGILVRDCRNFAGLGPDYFRAAVGLRPQNRRLLANLLDILK
ncbi:L-threonine O-3-phosphate decarboxylase [Hydrogenispora ethanolica]|jgi:threonine-phosphate decarboxylase|uniref:Aminotransferase n=1 Tax=Hydrogenispora ethanolica TaxID=1082276 RepID=A0A4R1S4Q4_HYDET|nr:aminotransferase class I/II-fold pyridoxal phosphate-dependent enzyme [Hydrogenispora ethanolica]TCL74089.1 L-threonine O-3-phosphate decarboxylase [Hydrogenispora ethanolica]